MKHIIATLTVLLLLCSIAPGQNLRRTARTSDPAPVLEMANAAVELANATAAPAPDLEGLVAAYVAAHEDMVAKRAVFFEAYDAEHAAQLAIVAYMTAPPVVVDPPVVVVSPTVGQAPPLDVTGLPFSPPAIPTYSIPTAAECDWIIENGVATSNKGLASITSVNAIGPAYRASIAAGHRVPIKFGVWDDAGRAVAGGLWNSAADHSVTASDGAGGWQDISMEIVGLDDSCEVILGTNGKWGFTDHISAFNIGLRGPDDSFIIRAHGGLGDVILDGCWWLAAKEYNGEKFHASGISIDNWRTLVWRNHKWRGVLPGTPGLKLREHSAYINSSNDPNGGTWIIGNDLRGGNRTGFQIRPDRQKTTAPVAPVVIAYNYADGQGWNWVPNDGGSTITVWSSPTSPVYVFRNRITDSKYGCFVLSPQAPHRNFLNEDGFPIEEVFVFENHFENKRGGRDCVSLTGVETLHWHENVIDSGGLRPDMTLDSPWGMRVSEGLGNGKLIIHGEKALEQLLEAKVVTYDSNDPKGKKNALLADEVLRAALAD